MVIAIATKVSPMRAITITAVVPILALITTMISNSPIVWFTAILAFSFCSVVAVPFELPFLIIADPSRRSAIFVGTAQLIGVAAGPLIASAVVSNTDYNPARLASIACFAIFLAIAAVIHTRARRRFDTAHHHLLGPSSGGIGREPLPTSDLP